MQQAVLSQASTRNVRLVRGVGRKIGGVTILWPRYDTRPCEDKLLFYSMIYELMVYVLTQYLVGSLSTDIIIISTAQVGVLPTFGSTEHTDHPAACSHVP